MLTKELEEVRASLVETCGILETFKAENSKLHARANLENEVLELATSLQSARNEIGFVQLIPNRRLEFLSFVPFSEHRDLKLF